MNPQSIYKSPRKHKREEQEFIEYLQDIVDELRFREKTRTAIRVFKLSDEVGEKVDLENSKVGRILTFIHNDKLFRIGDTGITSRSAVYLEKHGLMKEKPSNAGWRKLDFVDAVYFDLLVELRNYGLSTKKMVFLKEAFYENEIEVDALFFAAFFGYEITLVIYSDGGGFMMDPKSYAFFETNVRKRIDKSRIIIELNPFINKALIAQGIPPIPVTHRASDYMADANGRKK